MGIELTVSEVRTSVKRRKGVRVNQCQKTQPDHGVVGAKICRGSIGAGERPGGCARTVRAALWSAARTATAYTIQQGSDRTLTILTPGTSEQVSLCVHHRQCVPGASLGRLPLQGSLLPRHRLQMVG